MSEIQHSARDLAQEVFEVLEVPENKHQEIIDKV